MNGYDPESPVQLLLYNLRRTPGVKCVLLYHNNAQTGLASNTGNGQEIRDRLTIETHFSGNSNISRNVLRFPQPLHTPCKVCLPFPYVGAYLFRFRVYA